MLQLRLLGPPYAELDGRRLDFAIDKPALLLLYLACRGDWVGRETLAFLFWPDTDDKAARRNLRQMFFRCRGREWAARLEVQPQRARLDIPTDLMRFRHAIGEGAWQTALDRYSGRLLDGVDVAAAPGFEARLGHERERLHASWRHAALATALELEQAHRHGDAAVLLRRVWDVDPLDEAVLQAYLRNLSEGGDREAALAAFADFVGVIETELGLAPLEGTTDLVALIRSGRTIASPESPTVARLPRPATAFLGRRAELSELAMLRERPECRFLVLVGPGGVGKTRLALQLATDLVESFEGASRSFRWRRSRPRTVCPWPSLRRSISFPAARPMSSRSWSTSCATRRCCWSSTIWSTCWRAQLP